MFIGHLPAGYILTKALQKKLQTSKYLFIGLIASILPDLDMFYFYFVDQRQSLHHSYWIHLPFYWLIIAIFTFLVLWIAKKKDYLVAATIFFSNIFLHLFLDTIVGRIEWLFPFTDKAYYLFNVPSVHSFWVYNFIFHWTFLFEVGVVAWALYFVVKEKTRFSKFLRLMINFPWEIAIWFMFLMRILLKPACDISDRYCDANLPMIADLHFSLIFELLTSAMIPLLFFLLRRWIMNSWKRWKIFERVVMTELFVFTGLLYLITIFMLFVGKQHWCITDDCAVFIGHFIFLALVLSSYLFQNIMGFLVFGLPAILVLIISMIYKLKNNNST